MDERRLPKGRPLSIALVGTRGVPAHYGGFESAVEEVGARLVARGHRVRVYCRTGNSPDRLASHLGMDLVTLAAARRRSLETVTHTALSAAHLAFHRVDVAFVFNAANAVWLPLVRAARIPVATHVDGLEWRRAKWGPTGRRYYRWAEQFAVRHSDALIADARGIADYYAREFDVPTSLIAYGAPKLGGTSSGRIDELGLRPRGYHLVVARFEPENHVADIVQGYASSGARLPLVVVGSAPYAAAYTAKIDTAAAGDPRIRLLGGVWDQELLDHLYANSCTYIHGHSVGGTNPSLLRALGAGAAVVAYDVSFNREVAGGAGTFFRDAEGVGRLVASAETDPGALDERRALARARAEAYDWDDVADGYERLARELAERRAPGPWRRARRSRRPGWDRQWGEATTA